MQPYPAYNKTLFRGLTAPRTDSEHDHYTTVLENELPCPDDNEIAAPNPFLKNDGSSNLDAIQAALTNTDHIDAVELATKHPNITTPPNPTRNQAIKAISDAVTTTDHLDVDSHKLIIDPRRALLNALGTDDTEFTWNTASSKYNHGNPVEFLKQKAAALSSEDIEQDPRTVHGWLETTDHGGEVKLVTVYPTLEHEIQPEEVVDATLPAVSPDDEDDGEIVNASDVLKHSKFLPTQQDEEQEQTVFFGDQITYDLKGSSTLKLQPILHDPDTQTVIAVGNTKTRRHVGDIDSDTRNWHRDAFVELEATVDALRSDVLQAFAVTIDRDELPFPLADFYQYLGLKNKSVQESAARYAKQLATVRAAPSLWALQIGLKIALREDFNGKPTGRTYQAYEAVATELLNNPVTQLSLALKQYDYEQEQAQEQAKSESREDSETSDERIGDTIELDETVEDVLEPSNDNNNEQVTLSKAVALQEKIDPAGDESQASVSGD
jgi:hypothetical protein